MKNKVGIYNIASTAIEKKYDFVAIIITQWHLMSFLAALHYLESVFSKKMKGIVAISEHPFSNYCLAKEDVDTYLDNNIVSVFFQNDIKTIDKIRQANRNIRYTGCIMAKISK